MLKMTFEELFTYQNLYKAHLQGRKCKRDKKPLVRFELSTLEHLFDLYERLQNGAYRSGRYHSFTVEDPKRREIQTLPYEDRIVQHVVCDCLLTPYFTKRTVVDNCACQKGKGMHFALARFEKNLQQFVRKHGVNGYFLKCDILKYFPSIPHEQLKRIFCNEIEDEKIKKFLCEVIDSYSTKEKYLTKYGISVLADSTGGTGRGIPIGNQTSQVFGMFYLNGVDRLVKEKLGIKVYSRYMDDFILLHEDRQYIEHAREVLTRAVEDLGLTFNSKTQIFPIKNGVSYLGFRFIVTPTGRVVRMIKKASKQRLRWRSKLLKKAYLDGTIPIERVKNSQAAFHGHLMHGDCYRFEKELEERLTFKSDTEEKE